MQYPRISIVTPNFNQGQFIEQTILSVLNQNYPNLEYIVIDGGSTDNSVEIIKKYEKHLTYWVSEKDKGQYHALQKGLSMATGDIITYLNSDDIFAQNTFEIVTEIFSKFPQIEWLTGLGARIDEKGRVVSVAGFERWNKYKYYTGNYKYIQQEGTFWKKSLWDKTGGYISTDYMLASDMELWNRFFKVAQLYTVNIPTGYFRLRSKDQKSLTQITQYNEEALEILKKNILSSFELKQIKNHQLSGALKKYPVLGRLGEKIKSEVDEFPLLVAFERMGQDFILYNPEQ